MNLKMRKSLAIKEGILRFMGRIAGRICSGLFTSDRQLHLLTLRGSGSVVFGLFPSRADYLPLRPCGKVARIGRRAGLAVPVLPAGRLAGTGFPAPNRQAEAVALRTALTPARIGAPLSHGTGTTR
jgi:hypothetical protein